MKKILYTAFFLFLAVAASYAQDRYVIFFSDKNNSPYSVSAPQDFLSQRAINRRNIQNIPVTVEDLPVNPTYVSGVNATGATVLNRSKWFNSITVSANANQLQSIQNLPYVTQAIQVGRTAGTLGRNKFT